MAEQPTSHTLSKLEQVLRKLLPADEEQRRAALRTALTVARRPETPARQAQEGK